MRPAQCLSHPPTSRFNYRRLNL
uniref:Uncharacterized protein n=1 Tax=Anguilla anguilla TaxID=7936 RepID=A0A0E9V8G3_ANGAN